jgi:hypothetical protein
MPACALRLANPAKIDKMNIDTFLQRLDTAPDTITFADTMAAIDAAYEFTPAAFSNGTLTNAAGQNSGSCKLLAFAWLKQLSQEQTLACFGAYYRDDVLKNPNGGDHQNIRNFMVSGWPGVKFERMPLQAK